MPRVLLSWLILLIPAALSAQIASPGKLSAVHEKLEGVQNCNDCHNFGEKSFRSNCLKCHVEIGTRIEQSHGYHYFTRKVECNKCHKEHHGRSFNIIRWEPNSFDHKQTGFVLEGAHAPVHCRKCHNPGNIKSADILKKKRNQQENTYLGLSTDCENCHEDEHRGQLKNCASCHGMDDWKKQSFSHDKARFPLTGRHGTVACDRCHPQKEDGRTIAGNTRYLQFRGISFSGCIDCHEDRHQGTFGKDCAKCHSTAGWKQLHIAEGSFDHAKTAFPLEGLHGKVSCAQCHEGGNFGRFKGKDLTHCSLCHADEHAGQFTRRIGEDCSACHSVNGYSPARFSLADHDSTRFVLEGAHQAIPCTRCHETTLADKRTTRQFHWAKLDCQSCHRDPHAGQLDVRIARDGCTGCHTTDSWMVLDFDHSGTAFPLEGAHRTVLCEKCHVRGVISDAETVVFHFEDRRCDACHKDYHAGQFAETGGRTDCAKCHGPAAWKDLRFDHATMSRFPLTGKHAALACDRCHETETRDGSSLRLYKLNKIRCADCHETGS